jgi:hypothetical protein
MKQFTLAFTASLLILSVVGCALIPDLPPPATPTPAIPPSGYEPQAGDDGLKRDQVFLDVENSQVVVMESYPIQVSVVLKGNLPDPCHELRVVVTSADVHNEINLDVYSVVDSSKACITVLQPFEVTIPLGSYTSGHYAVNVNGQLLGEFDG